MKKKFSAWKPSPKGKGFHAENFDEFGLQSRTSILELTSAALL